MRMGGVSCCAGPLPTVTTLTLSSPRKATPFRIILWRCSAIAEHEIAQPKPRDPILLDPPSADHGTNRRSAQALLTERLRWRGGVARPFPAGNRMRQTW